MEEKQATSILLMRALDTIFTIFDLKINSTVLFAHGFDGYEGDSFPWMEFMPTHFELLFQYFPLFVLKGIKTDFSAVQRANECVCVCANVRVKLKQNRIKQEQHAIIIM